LLGIPTIPFLHENSLLSGRTLSFGGKKGKPHRFRITSYSTLRTSIACNLVGIATRGCKHELWTVSGKKEVWATMIQNGPDRSFPCAFGLKEQVGSYAKKLSESKGVLVSEEVILVPAPSQKPVDLRFSK
jgi:hypothetical protein